MFADRAEAGKKLAKKLGVYRGADAVVLGLPRGGVPVAAELAAALKLPLDIIAVRKIGHPDSAELAIGAVDDAGELLLDEKEASTLSEEWLRVESVREQKEAARRVSLYRAGKKQLSLSGKLVIITDDGVATGYTMRLAVRRALKDGAKRVVVAIPVAPASAVRALEKEGAEVVVYEPPKDFQGAVGAHYADFPQLTDVQVVSILAEREGAL